MELKETFQQVMLQTENMALATSVGDMPNVRVVTFGYDVNKEGKVFFTTFPGNVKMAEFELNANVACTPLPESPDIQAQVRIQGTVRKSDASLAEVAPLILKKFPDFQQMLDTAGDVLVVYEVCFTQAAVTVGMNPPSILTFTA